MLPNLGAFRIRRGLVGKEASEPARKLPFRVRISHQYGLSRGNSGETHSCDSGADLSILRLRTRLGDRSATGFTALGLRRPVAGESAMTVNGVLYPVEGADMSLFDRREAGYARVDVPLDVIEAVSWQQAPATGKVWVYIPIGRNGKIGEDLPVASATYPLLQSYIDVVLDGALEHSWDFARELVETTQDWSPYWLNDRELPRRPWVFDKNYAEEDQLLRETQPAAGHFDERLLPEVFAVRHGQSVRP